jgi:putative endonuclease
VAGQWCVYLIECDNASLYTGITNQLEKRYEAHLKGKGARYTRMHKPKRFIGSLTCNNRSDASKLEHQIKQLTPADKRLRFAR